MLPSLPGPTASNTSRPSLSSDICAGCLTAKSPLPMSKKRIKSREQDIKQNRLKLQDEVLRQKSQTDIQIVVTLLTV